MPGFNPFRYRFPYTNINDINLDWIIKQVKQLASALQGKQDKPDSTGTAGQVLGLDSSLNPVWVDQSGGGGGTTNYNSLENKPQIQGITLTGNKTASDLGLALSAELAEKQDAPILSGAAGQVLGLDSSLNPVWVDQSGGGTTNYNSLENKPQINSITLSGNKSAAELGLANYRNLTNKPQINGVTLNGDKSAADLGLAAKSFIVVLSSASWSNNEQIVSNANFYASGYSYIVSPSGSSFADYAAAVIYADDVTVDGSMTFHCTNVPSSTLTVNIQRSVSA